MAILVNSKLYWAHRGWMWFPSVRLKAEIWAVLEDLKAAINIERGLLGVWGGVLSFSLLCDCVCSLLLLFYQWPVYHMSRHKHGQSLGCYLQGKCLHVPRTWELLTEQVRRCILLCFLDLDFAKKVLSVWASCGVNEQFWLAKEQLGSNRLFLSLG